MTLIYPGNTPKFGNSKRFELFRQSNKNIISVNTQAERKAEETDTSMNKDIDYIHFETAKGEKDSPLLDIYVKQVQSDSYAMDTSPKKKIASLKHPLISRKSPLFSKFGMENENPGNIPNSKAESLKMRLRSRRSNITVDHIDQNMMTNIVHKSDNGEILGKHIEHRNTSFTDTNGNGSTNASSTNAMQEKARENFTFYVQKQMASVQPEPLLKLHEVEEDNPNSQNFIPEESRRTMYATKAKSLPLDENNTENKRNPLAATKKLNLLPPKQINNDKGKSDFQSMGMKPATSHKKERSLNEIRDLSPKVVLKRRSLLESDFEKEAAHFSDISPKITENDSIQFNKEEMIEEYILPDPSKSSDIQNNSNIILPNSRGELDTQQSNKLLRKSNSESNFNFLEGEQTGGFSNLIKPIMQNKVSSNELYDPPFQSKVANFLQARTKTNSSNTSSPKQFIDTSHAYHSASKVHKMQNQTMYYHNK